VNAGTDDHRVIGPFQFVPVEAAWPVGVAQSLSEEVEC
jgi:hypothetical protein